STVAWIWLVGVLGSKTKTFGPKSGAAAECDAVAPPVPASATNTATTIVKRRAISNPPSDGCGRSASYESRRPGIGSADAGEQASDARRTSGRRADRSRLRDRRGTDPGGGRG